MNPLGAFGIATGQLVMNALARRGVVARGWRWNYRPHRIRDSFPPHRLLHNTRITGLDDPKLLNVGTFPKTTHYHPGDHDGCLCGLRPRLGRQR